MVDQIPRLASRMFRCIYKGLGSVLIALGSHFRNSLRLHRPLARTVLAKARRCFSPPARSPTACSGRSMHPPARSRHHAENSRGRFSHLRFCPHFGRVSVHLLRPCHHHPSNPLSVRCIDPARRHGTPGRNQIPPIPARLVCQYFHFQSTAL